MSLTVSIATTSSIGLGAPATAGWLICRREKAADARALQYVSFASSFNQLVEQDLAVGRKIGRSLWQGQLDVECIHGENILVRCGSESRRRAWTVVLLPGAEVILHLLAKRTSGHPGGALWKTGRI